MAYTYSRRDFIAGVLATGTISAGITYFAPGGRTLPSVTLRMISGEDPTGARKLLVSMWNQANPRSEVDVVEVAGTNADQRVAMRNAVSLKQADVLNLDTIDIPYFRAENFITPIELNDVAQFIPQVLLTSTCDEAVLTSTCEVQVGEVPAGPYWAAPFNADVGMLFERVSPGARRELQPVSLATTLDEDVPDGSEQFAGQLQSLSLVTAESFVVNVLEHALARDDEILTRDAGRPARALETWQNALEPLREARVRGRLVLCNGETATRDAFADRGLRLMRNWPVQYRKLQTMPVAETGAAEVHVRPITSGILGGQSLALVRTSAYPDRARQLIHFLTSGQAQQIIASYGLAPTRTDAYSDPGVRAFVPHLESIQGAVERAHRRPVLKNYNRFSDVVYRHVLPLIERDEPLTTNFIDEMQNALS